MKDETVRIEPLLEVVAGDTKTDATAPESEGGTETQTGTADTSGKSETELDVKKGLSPVGKVLVGVSIAFWLGIFLGGILVDTQPFRKAISPAGFTSAVGVEEAAKVVAYPGPRLGAALGAYLFYTPTNLAILTMLAGLLGALGRKASLHIDPNDKQEADRINPKLSALLRSFLIYLFFLSGVLFFADEPFSSPSPASYLRLAGIISLFSFVANYSPSIFSAVLEDAHNYIRSRNRQASEEEAPS